MIIKRMYKVTIGAQSVIHDNLESALDELKTLLPETEESIAVEPVGMTREQYENLEESDGW